jgi:protein-L-isoaspartate(D-aspartate) O-methyltransferase
MDFTAARQHMVESQIRTSRVTDERLVAAMAETPREIFIPKDAALRAYIDDDVRIAEGRFLMEPMVLARLLQAAEISAGDHCLVIGATTGYAAAIMGALGASIIALESDPALADAARRNLAGLGRKNVEIVTGPLSHGCPGKSPYQVILIDGCVERIDEPILSQLADGGKLVTVRRDEGQVGHAILVAKTGGGVVTRNLFDANVAPLPGFQRAKQFTF